MTTITKLNKLDKEIKQLDKHKTQLIDRLANQIYTIKNVYSDPEYREKIGKINEEISKTKEIYDRGKIEKTRIKEKQKQVLNDLALIEAEHRQWKDKKMALEYNHRLKDVFKKEIENKDELLTIKKRNQNFEQLTINKQIKMIDKILAKEEKWNKISEEIKNLYGRIKEANRENEHLSEEVKNLKMMLPKPTLKVRNSPEKPLFIDEKDVFSNQGASDMML